MNPKHLIFGVLFFAILACSPKISTTKQPSSVSSALLVFLQKEEITLSDTKDFIKKAIEDVKREKAEAGESLDDDQLAFLEQVTEQMPMIMAATMGENEIIKHHLEFDRDTLISYTTHNNKPNRQYQLIKILNTNKWYKREYGEPKSLIEFEVYKSTSPLSDIVINKNDNREILGYPCFRISFSIPRNSEDDFELIAGDRIFEMYVTESIQSPYHPIIDFDQVLNKFFPLEITEYHKNFPGMKTISTAEVVNILKP